MTKTIRKFVRDHNIQIAKEVYKALAIPLYRVARIPLYDISSSKKYKYTWFRIPKNGTHSIMHCLSAAPPDVNSSYVPYFKKAHRDNFKFCFIRNPWDRLVSVYSNKVQMQLMYPECWNKDFSFFIDFVSAQNLTQCDAHLRLQTVMFPSDEIDFVGRMEHFDKDMGSVADHLGIDVDAPHEGKVEHADYHTYYSIRLKEKVAKLYAADVLYGRYAF